MILSPASLRSVSIAHSTGDSVWKSAPSLKRLDKREAGIQKRFTPVPDYMDNVQVKSSVSRMVFTRGYFVAFVGVMSALPMLAHAQTAPAGWQTFPSADGVRGRSALIARNSLAFDMIGADLESLRGVVSSTFCQDMNRFHAEHLAGEGGVLVMSEAGIEGPVLAVLRREDKSLSVVYRSRTGEPLRTVPLGATEKDGLQLVRRDPMIYAYASDAGGSEPLVAVDFDFGKKPVMGVIAGNGFQCSAPQLEAVPATQSLTVNVAQNQPGITLHGDWRNEISDGAVNSPHLVTDGTDADAAAVVQINGLLAGFHDLWLRYHADPGRSPEAAVSVEGLGEPKSFLIDQRVAGGVWLGIGRYAVEGAANPRVTIQVGKIGTGSLSVEAIHHLWAEWVDDDHNAIPDVWEVASGSKSKISALVGASPGNGAENVGRFIRGSSPNENDRKAPAAGASDDAIFFVNSEGDDANDGRSGQSVPGAWVGIRGGPKRTVKAALKSIGTAKTIELHLDGAVELPPGGLQNLGGVGISLIGGSHGFSLQSIGPVVPPPVIPLPNPQPEQMKGKP